MRLLACFLYVVLSLAYLIVGDSSIIWGGVNIFTQIGFIAFLSMQLSLLLKGMESLFLKYIFWLSIGNCLYIAVCVFKNRTWVYYNTDIFAYIMGIGFLAFLIHCAIRK